MKPLALVLLTVLASACGTTEAPNISGEIASEDTIEAIPIPFWENGYHQFNTSIIDSETAYNDFIERVNAQEHWNDKESFLAELSANEIDYSQFSLLFFPMTQSSSSIRLFPHDPILSNETIIIEIERKIPQAGTDGMASYALAYKFDKNIDQFNIWLGNQIHVIENRPDFNIVPLNCSSWNDGCNECGRGADGMVLCTQKACLSPGQLRCRTWSE